MLQRISGTYPEVAQALDLLGQWDHRIAPQSAAAALFEVWWTRHLKPALLHYLAPHSSLRTLLAPGDNETLLALLECPDQEFDRSWAHKRDFLLVSTLTAAMTECREILGAAIELWRWGMLHQNTFVHPLSSTAEPGSHSLRDVGPLPVGGSELTPCYASYRSDNFAVTTGASFRLVVDVGNWDESWVVNAPGQSGNPSSQHYDDHAVLWAHGNYVPLLFSQGCGRRRNRNDNIAPPGKINVMQLDGAGREQERPDDDVIQAFYTGLRSI